MFMPASSDIQIDALTCHETSQLRQIASQFEIHVTDKKINVFSTVVKHNFCTKQDDVMTRH